MPMRQHLLAHRFSITYHAGDALPEQYVLLLLCFRMLPSWKALLNVAHPEDLPLSP